MLKSYTKSFAYSYSIGVYPTLELLQNRPSDVLKIIIDDRGNTNTGLNKILDLCKKTNVVTETNQPAIRKIAKSENAYCVGVFNKYSCNLENNRDHLVLVNPSDMGNLGTILRTALAFDVVNIAIIKPACDIFDPKVVRSSMGALFKIRFGYFDAFEDYQRHFDTTVYCFKTNADQNLADSKFNHPFALVFGNEGAGLPPEFDRIGQSVKISQSKNVDSLNLSIAVGIALNYAYKDKYGT